MFACTVFILVIMSIHVLILVAFICFKICGVCCIPLLCLNLSSMAAKKVIKTAMKTKQQKLEKPEKAEKAEKPTTATLFDVTIKSHYMAHVILQSREENPRSSWCYGGEHLMADFKKTGIIMYQVVLFCIFKLQNLG